MADDFLVLEMAGWQWRYRSTDSPNDKWSDWKYGHVPHDWWRTFGSSYTGMNPLNDFQTEERPLYALPVDFHA